MKKGFLSSEFWITLLTQIVGFVVLSGKLNPDDGKIITSQLDAVVKGVVDLITGLYMIYTAVEYIRGRIHLKKTVIEKESNSVKV